ncbi:transposase [Streptomyces scabiei]|uniref:transposase n=1 Tax=Streptomyces scabiei TaxID=1930 RepID=UPI0029905306|nr:transposase [Streptomyces scabiei]MDW8809405.1 transposase [Streptomyces scabiei]
MKVLPSSTVAGWRDRAGVLTHLTDAIALGATNPSEAEQLQLHHRPLFGPSVSDSTARRTLAALDGTVLAKTAKVRARVRRHVWSLLHLRPGGFPWLTVAGKRLTGWIVIDLDATIITSASKKTGTAGTFTKAFGFHPLAAWCANTTESLAMLLRPGNAGANTVADHVRVLTDTLAQIPGSSAAKILVRVDGAGATPRAAGTPRSVEHHAAHGPLHRRLEDHRRRREGHRKAARKCLGDLRAPRRQPPGRLLRRGVDRAEHPRGLAGGHAADRAPRQAPPADT